MEYSLFTKLAAEFVGTAVLMVFGNGSVANAELKNTKGYHAGWLNIAMGYGFGVMFPVLMFGGVSGAHQPGHDHRPGRQRHVPVERGLPYIIAQLLGALVGQFIVYVTYLPALQGHRGRRSILGTFCTTDAHNDRRELLPQRVLRHLHAGARRPVLPVSAVGQGRPRRRVHRGRLHRMGPRDLHGRPDRPWPEPGLAISCRDCCTPSCRFRTRAAPAGGEAWIPVVAPIFGAILGAFLFNVLFA